jgi:hypothetical protein
VTTKVAPVVVGSNPERLGGGILAAHTAFDRPLFRFTTSRNLTASCG